MSTPVPFYSARGTPFSTYTRCMALSSLGYDIDLLTYPIGSDIKLEGLRIFRTWRPPFIREIGTGLSVKMLILDLLLSIKLIFWRKAPYSFIHAHEETIFAGVLCKKISGLPLLYDMHSSIPQQLSNFGTTRSKTVISLMRWLEAWAIRNSDVVIAICPDLVQRVKEINPKSCVHLIENLPVGFDILPKRKDIRGLESRYGLHGRSRVVYTGTLGYNQGIDLLLEAAAKVVEERRNAIFLVVGGEKELVDRYRSMAASKGLSRKVIFTGKFPAELMPAVEQLADVLVSPRLTGTNTPLKLYSYMRSGKPIVATNLLTHTQVLDKRTAILTGTDPASFASGITWALAHRGAASARAARAKRKLERYYSFTSFLKKSGAAIASMKSGKVNHGR
jgi:glycosyltransferase involved in cell wall biosynthesis